MTQSAVAGLLAGGIYALLGGVTVLMFRMVRTVNFAQAAIGAMGVYVASVIHAHGGAYVVATVGGIAVSTAIGALMGAAMARWFAEATIETRSAVTIGALVALLMIGFRVFGDSPRDMPSLVGGTGVHLFSVVLGWSSLIIIGTAVALGVGAGLFLSRTVIGLRLRAMAERPRTSELVGIPVQVLTVGVWAASSAVTEFGIQVVAPLTASDFLSLSLLAIPSFAAAALGAFRSLRLAIAGGLLVGVIEGMAAHSNAIGKYQEALPLIVLALALSWSQRKEVWGSAR